MADPEDREPGIYEGAVRSIIRAAWENSPIAWEHKIDPSKPPTFPDFVNSTLDILRATEDAVALLGRQIDEILARQEGSGSATP